MIIEYLFKIQIKGITKPPVSRNEKYSSFPAYRPSLKQFDRIDSKKVSIRDASRAY